MSRPRSEECPAHEFLYIVLSSVAPTSFTGLQPNTNYCYYASTQEYIKGDIKLFVTLDKPSAIVTTINPSKKKRILFTAEAKYPHKES